MVLTRREQLGLAADAKDDTKKGRGRGRGCGRGRGKIAERPVDGEILGSKTANEEEEPIDPVRRLDFSENDENGPAEPPKEMEVDPAPKKRTRAKPKAKAKAKAKGNDEAPPNDAAEAEVPMASSPPIKQKKKRAKGPSKDAAAPDAEPVPSAAAAAAAGDVEAVPAEKGKKGPGRAAIKWAENHLKESSQDPAALWHMSRLWGFETIKVSQETWGSFPKPTYFGYSMYWKTRRVGLLVKGPTSKDSTHVTSFGGERCRSISLSLKAAMMFVAALVVIQGIGRNQTNEHMFSATRTWKL